MGSGGLLLVGQGMGGNGECKVVCRVLRCSHDGMERAGGEG